MHTGNVVKILVGSNRGQRAVIVRISADPRRPYPIMVITDDGEEWPYEPYELEVVGERLDRLELKRIYGKHAKTK